MARTFNSEDSFENYIRPINFNLPQILIGSDQDDYIRGGRKNDLLEGGKGDDYLDGGAGNDTLTGGEGRNYLTAGAGNDLLIGGDGSNYMNGGDGNDEIRAADSADHSVTIDNDSPYNNYLSGGNGNDLLISANGNDYLSGGNGNDTLYGGDGNDYLNLGAGNDFADGGAGDDVISVRTSVGSGMLTGGDGADTFSFHVAPNGRESASSYTITDFNVAEDVLILKKNLTASDHTDMQLHALDAISNVVHNDEGTVITMQAGIKANTVQINLVGIDATEWANIMVA